jgi:hypothetical protein
MIDDLGPWPEKLYLLHPSIKTFGGMVSNPERREYVRADRIEELERERHEAINAAWRNGIAQEAAEAKLAKAGIVALETILNERGLVFDAMVEAAEDAAGKGVSFNVVVGRAIRAALAELEGKQND